MNRLNVRTGPVGLPASAPLSRSASHTVLVTTVSALRNAASKTFDVVLLSLVSLVFVFPFAWMATTALKSLQETLVFPPIWIPERLHWENFSEAWKSGPFLTYLRNSVMVAVSVLLLQLVTITPAAYAFARFRFPGKRALFGLVLASLMMPPQITFVPVYVLMSRLGLMDTFVPLVVPFAASAFGIFLMRQAFMQVPDETAEAARLDNAGEWTTMWRIFVPMAKPMLATFALFSLIAHWNDYFWPLVMTDSDRLRTLAVGIARLKDIEGGNAWQVIMAGNVMLVLPILAAFFAARRHIVRAFTYTGLK